MISAFKQTYPDVEISVLLGNSQQTFERLLRYDAGLRVGAVHCITSSHISVRWAQIGLQEANCRCEGKSVYCNPQG